MTREEQKEYDEKMQQKILDILSGRDWMTVRQIGLELGFPKELANGNTKRLVRRMMIGGLIEKSLARGYRSKKMVTEEVL